MAMRLSTTDKLEMVVKIYGELCANRTDDEIMGLLGVDGETYADLKRMMYVTRSEEIRGKPRETVYIDYVIEQRSTIKRIDEMLTDLKTTKQHNAMVGALRLRADLVDRVMDRGFDLGLVKKTPERKEVIAGLMVADMSTPELKKLILSQTKTTIGMMKKYGDGDLMALPPGPTHYGDPSFIRDDDEEDDEAELRAPVKSTGKLRAKTSRVHAGRRRVIEAKP